MKTLIPIYPLAKFFRNLSFYFLIYFFLTPNFISAQRSVQACGAYHLPSAERSIGQSADLMDQFGNQYMFEDLNIRKFRERYPVTTLNSNNCVGGDFTLEFFGLSVDEETTICNVFQELSNIVDIGPNGSSPLITVIKEPFMNEDGSNNTSTLGTGTPLFITECGVSNNLIFDVMYSGVSNNLPSGTASGVLRINSLLPFYNDVQGPIGGHYDLHTVALHEALHIMGYSSLIQNGGGNFEDTYSQWDLLLYSEDDLEHLITAGTSSAGCCDFSEFNPNLDYNQVIQNDCAMNVFVRGDGQNIAQAFGVNYPITNPSGLLSHLDRCGTAGDPYVMNAELDVLEEKDITLEEIDILEALGYEMQGQDVACSVIANNDFFFVGNTNQQQNALFLYNEIFANDNLPDDFDPTTDLVFHGVGSGCGTLDDIDPGILYFEEFSTHFRIRIPLCESVDICYTINGCNGACDDGVITIQRVCQPCYPYLPDCAANICAGDNLFCYGDFEQFIPKQTSTSFTDYDPVFELEMLHCPSLVGSPDIYYNPVTDNRLLRFFSGSESAIIPLGAAVQPGCSIDISFRTNATTDGNIHIFGTSESPCLSDQTAVCPSTPQSDFQCIDEIAVVDGFPGNVVFSTTFINCDNTAPPDIDCACSPEYPIYEVENWTNVTTTTFVNSSDDAISFIYLTYDAVFPSYVYIDDLVVTANCDNEATLNVETPVDVCQGDEAIVDVTFLVEGSNPNPQNVTITAEFASLPGVSITPNTDFDGGTALLNNVVAGPVGNPIPYVREFALQTGFALPVGSTIDVDFTFEIDGACSNNNVLTSTINIIACETPCVLQDYPTIRETCTNDGGIEVIIAGGSGSYTFSWSDGLGNGSSVDDLEPGTYTLTVTDANDPNCILVGEYTVPLDEDCNTGCEGVGTFEIRHEVVEIVCLESGPNYFRYYIDMYIPNWDGTQNVDFELCSEDLFATTPGVVIESNESYLIQEFAALNIFTIIQVPFDTPIDQGICFETPVCTSNGIECGSYCVDEFPDCMMEGCELEIVPNISLTGTGITCGNLSGDDLSIATINLEIQNIANGFIVETVQYTQLNGNADPVIWQANNPPQGGGTATIPEQSLCWKSYDNQYFCFKVTVVLSNGIEEYVCEENICLPVRELEDGAQQDKDKGGRRGYAVQPLEGSPSFTVFPNPVNQFLIVQNNESLPVSLQWTTLRGAILKEQNMLNAKQAKS